MYRGVAELKRRDLVQQRGKWRAVLPHAIANRLAGAALENVAYADIELQIVTRGAERLTKSFSRRLGYLHTSVAATGIVSKWLAIGGHLEHVVSLNDLGQAMFKNVAPAAPTDALTVLERAILGPDGDTAAKQCSVYCDLLHSLAYDPALFDRAVALLATLATAEDVNPREHSTEVFASLFHLILSGTRATVEQRTAIVDSLLRSPDEKHRALGVLSLKALLEALYFRAVGNFDFGARSRDFGYWPRQQDEIRHWFSSALRVVQTFACNDGPAAPHVRAALAEKFRGLWLRSGIQDEVATVCAAVRKYCFWPEGWLAVRETSDLDSKGFDEECLTKLVSLEQLLRPADLVQKVRAVVFSTPIREVDLSDFEDDSSADIVMRMARTDALARDLGSAVSAEPDVLKELLPEIVSSDGRLWLFGQGLAAAAPDPRDLWQQLVDAFTGITESAAGQKSFRDFCDNFASRNRSSHPRCWTSPLSTKPWDAFTLSFKSQSISIERMSRG